MKIEIEIKKEDDEYKVECEELGFVVYKKDLKYALEYISEQIYVSYIIAKNIHSPLNKNLNERGKKHQAKFMEIDNEGS